MNYIYIIIATCFLSFSLKGEKDKTYIVDKIINKVEFELVDGLILLPLTVDGIEGTYILDTGAPHLTLNRKVDKVEFTLNTYARSHNGQLVDVAGIQYGQIFKGDVKAWAMDLSFIEQMIDRPIAGILGAGFLRDFDVLIDFESGELQLLSPESKSLSLDASAYNISFLKIMGYHNQLPLVNVSIGGAKHDMIFDTGAAISILDIGIKSSMPMRSSKGIKINNVRIEKAPFLNANISHLSDSDQHTFDGILSVSSLNASKVLLSHSSSRVFLFWNKSSS